ncbi:ABC transporter substrate-binding protein [Rhodospira trueperi]|uniref:Putative hydroxymethylpyrimidine transport system substrate-binding protein n=1 Tax=Rhodospira trueperi TaxID=69960 RepID=A0A1G7DUP5_9PROT|nr:ABC transporter substrate-binding protein [Rhodospira trueperi]SDE55224.1 putative hydroxymethylpyrimidine transport system substrate-binding protein [Rhodospira trueperi]
MTLFPAHLRTIVPALILAGLTAAAQPARAEPLTVLLDWFVNPDHAPLVVAKEHGFFAEQGLEVSLIAPADPNDPPKLVAAGQAELAVSYQPNLHLQVDQGLPLVRVGTLVATPLNSVVVLADGPIQTLADLQGRTVGYSVGGFEDAVLGTMLESVGVEADTITLVNVNFSLSPSILSGQVDAVVGAYRNFELNQMDLVGRPGRAFYPEEHGVPLYDQLILVAHRDSVGDPRLARFMEALEQATQYLINHPDESWALFIKAYPDLDDDLNHRAWADTLPRFALRPAAVDGPRYARFSAFLAERGLIEAPQPPERLAVDVRVE